MARIELSDKWKEVENDEHLILYCQLTDGIRVGVIKISGWRTWLWRIYVDTGRSKLDVLSGGIADAYGDDFDSLESVTRHALADPSLRHYLRLQYGDDFDTDLRHVTSKLIARKIPCR